MPPAASDRPRFLGPDYAGVFQSPAIVDAYRHRPPYPEAVFALLGALMPAENRTVLDLGCGPGDLARRLVRMAERVDAVDFSPAMVEKGMSSPGGDHPGLRWICAPAETAPVDPPYALVTAGDSLHWMDWAIVLPRITAALAPAGALALVTRGWGTKTEEEAAILRRYSTNQDFRPFDLVRELVGRGLFQPTGRRDFSAPWLPTPGGYVGARHAQSGFSRDVMAPAAAAAFDHALGDLLTRLVRGGRVRASGDRLELTVRASVTWGRPTGDRPPA